MRALDDLLKIVVAGLEDTSDGANHARIVARPHDDLPKFVVAGLGGKPVRAKYVHQIAGQSSQPKTAKAYRRRRGLSAGNNVRAMISEPLAVGWMPSSWIVPGTATRSL